MTLIQPMEIAFDDIKHIIIDILLVEPSMSLCYFISGSVNVPNTDKTPGDFAFGVHAGV